VGLCSFHEILALKTNRITSNIIVPRLIMLHRPNPCRPRQEEDTTAAVAALPKFEAPSPSALHVAVLGDTDHYFLLSPARISQTPQDLRPFEALVLCPKWDVDNPTDSCPLAQRCRHVHADIRGLSSFEVHINYAWRALKEVKYARHAPGVLVEVAAPNSHSSIDVVDSGFLLLTKALDSSRRPLTHCAHYYYNRQCNLGSQCRFVHAVFVDPAAGTLRRAPAPVQLGRRPLCDTTPLGLPLGEHSSSALSVATSASSSCDVIDVAALDASELDHSYPDDVDTPNRSVTSSSGLTRWRHQPYRT